MVQVVRRRYLTTRESATRLGVTVNAIKTWIRGAELPALRTPGGHHRIAESDLVAFEARLRADSRGSGRRAPRVLIADDEAIVLSTLREALMEAAPGAQVALARDGYEALIQVGRFRPDLLVLDLRMPELDGFEVCRRLKARPETGALRILAISGLDDEGTRARVRACGADDFLEKPFSTDDFRDRALALLARVERGR